MIFFITQNGETPLHLGCKQGKVECVELLLLNSADVTIKNNDNKTPADVVKSDDNNKDRILQLIDKAVHGQCIVLQ